MGKSHQTAKKSKVLLFLRLVRDARLAPFELPQVGNEARVEGRSSAMRSLISFFSLTSSTTHHYEVFY